MSLFYNTFLSGYNPAELKQLSIYPVFHLLSSKGVTSTNPVLSTGGDYKGVSCRGGMSHAYLTLRVTMQNISLLLQITLHSCTVH